MKKWMLALTLASGVLALSACSSTGADKVAESSAGNITKDDLYKAMKDKVGSQALQQLILEKVLSKKYTVSDSDVNKKLNDIKNQYGASFQTALAQSGFKDENDFKSSIKDQLLIQKAAESDLSVTNKDLQDAYASYKPDIRARHILVADLKTANLVEQKLKSGAKFEDLAKQYSTDTASKTKGGDLGWFGTGVMDPTFEKAAYALKINQISTPVKTQFGYHVIQKTGEKQKKSFNQMKSQLKTQIITNKLSSDTNAISTILQKEFKDAKVKVDDSTLKDALNPSLGTGSGTGAPSVAG